MELIPDMPEIFCDDPIEPDVLTESPLEAALEWIEHHP
jgi:hypothetical protein